MPGPRSFAPWIVVAACLLSTAWPVPVGAAPKAAAVQAAQKLIADGKAAYRARDYEGAAHAYAEALKHVEHENLFFNYARSLEQLGQFKSAAFAYGRAEAMMIVGPARNTIAARGVSNAKLDEAQQLLNDGQPGQAQPMARAAHSVLFGQSRRAEDGQIYPEPASVLLLLARLELATGNSAAALQMVAEIRSDPTASQVILDQAAQLAATPPVVPPPVAAPVPPVQPEPAKPEPVGPEPVKPEPAKPEPVKPEAAPAEPTPPTTSAPQRHSPDPGPMTVITVKGVEPAQPLVRWLALGGSAAVAVAGGIWLAASAIEASDIQGKLDKARSSGGKVDGLTQSDYEAAKTRLDSAYFASSGMAIAGGVGVAASAAWLWWGPQGAVAGRVAVVPQPLGASVVVAW